MAFDVGRLEGLAGCQLDELLAGAGRVSDNLRRDIWLILGYLLELDQQ